MSRVNGIGTTWLGQTGRQGDECYATEWFTLLFAPLVPIKRCRLKLLPHHRGTGFSYRELERTPLVGREILGTLAFSWLLVPLLLIGPLAFCMPELQEALGIPKSLQTPMIIGALIWFVVFLWKLADYHENRYRPKK